MCGLVGYKNLDNKIFTYDSCLESAQQSIVHRGPDGMGVWYSSDKNIGLAHRRLSIVDLSTAGAQPMFDNEKIIAIVFNGEIYNYKKLRAELLQYGHRFISNTDTEVIIYAYKQWGIECLHRFEGMFAIALADLQNNELYLIRDRMGIKPIYFSLEHNILSFASEIKALWYLPWVSCHINPLSMYHYLTFLVTPAPTTLYQGIYKLPAGFYIKVKQNNVTFHQWYDVLCSFQKAAPQHYADEETCKQTIKHLLDRAVEKRLMSDVPYGAFLSGGIDSSLIVALMSTYTDNINTFNISFPDGQEFNESYWARKVATLFNTQHHEITITEQDAFNFFQDMVYYQDEPIADRVCIPLYFVSRLVKNKGVTVALAGEGSDELFCGYPYYTKHIKYYESLWYKSNKYLPAFAKNGIYHFSPFILKHRMHRLELLKNWSENKSTFWSGAIAFQEVWKKNFVQKLNYVEPDKVIQQIYATMTQKFDSYDIVDYHLSILKKYNPIKDCLTKITYLEFKNRLPDLLLTRLDKMTMATSVEGRVPFLDHKLVEYVLPMPNSYKLKNNTTKYILKKVAEDMLPHDIIYRKKTGFNAPAANWFKSGSYFKPYLHNILASKKSPWVEFINFDAALDLLKKHEAAKIEGSVQLWTLQNLITSKII